MTTTVHLTTAVDIVILSNGPGELATWVRPVVQSLRRRLGTDRHRVRISVILSPCANASGQEAEIARRYPEVDRVQAAADFYPFLLCGRTKEQWDWRPKGLVLFLGGDQFYTVVIGKRLGYRTVTYAEWEARWHRWIDRFAVMKPEIADRVNPTLAHKFTVVGDLMTEVGANTVEAATDPTAAVAPLMGILPGSKPAKLLLGVPLGLAIAEYLHRWQPTLRFGMAVAPTLTLAQLAQFADPQQNPVIQRLGWAAADLVTDPEGRAYLKTASGLRVELWTQFPAYTQLSQCALCLTTVGANTAELGALAIPMLVLIPTQQLDAMRAWDGIPGILANLPGVGSLLAKGINWLALRRLGLLAWPNIWAGKQIVPELVGPLQPAAVAAIAQDLLEHPEKLVQIRANLRQVRGEAGAAEKLVQLICEELEAQDRQT